ncbi:hypothetical protein [Chryseolinea sp. H1M3-3]|uniref:hypothetical protein n=1 Tax=Chryseolinea sp. H1M3-3 TaxID=3034144 RepID=UPI0023EC5F01|nr:hypothetical protein [Chryseolinea sp. H1M3-3]
MDDLDELMDRYPQYKDMVRDARKQARDIDKEIAKLQPGWTPPKLELKPPLSGTWSPSKEQGRELSELLEKKSGIQNGVYTRLEADLVGQDPSKIERTKRDVSKVLSHDKMLRFDIKDIDESQRFMESKIQERQAGYSKPSITDQLMKQSDYSKESRLAKEKEFRENSKSILDRTPEAE